MDVSESFSVSMEVFANPFSPNGVLFAIGWPPNFSFTSTYGQYLILEFAHSSVRTSNTSCNIRIGCCIVGPYDNWSKAVCVSVC